MSESEALSGPESNSRSPVPSPSRRGMLQALFILGLVGVVVAGIYFRPDAAPRASAPLSARLELAAGEVNVAVGGETQRMFSGAALLADSEVAAAEGGRAMLRLSDGAAVFLRGGARVKLLGNAISLLKGEVWIDAPPTDRKPGVHLIDPVEVSATEAGMSLKREDSGVTVYVARGQAVVTSPKGRVELQAGEQASLKGDAAPEVKPVAFWNDWTGGMGDHPASSALAGAGAGMLYGVDLYAGPGTAAKPLEISRQSIRATLRSAFAETEVDQTFFNPGDRPVEGWYWFTVPEGASITSFALETHGSLVEGELIEKKEAAAQYGRAVATGHEPALLEWVDDRTYRARIYPVLNGASRRVVVRYLELLPLVGGRMRYVYPMQSRHPARVGEFSLSVDLGELGKSMSLTTLADARIEDGGRRVTLRRSGYTPRVDFILEGLPTRKLNPVTVSRFSVGEDSADYLMMRYMPDIDWGAYKPQPGEVVVVVDTSAGGDDANRSVKVAAAEAILRALSEGDRFALVSLDIKPTVLYPDSGLAQASGAEISKALEKLADHPAGGATDLSAMFDVALERLHGGEQPAIVYVGDGIATSGELSSEQLIEKLRRTLSTSRARLFTIGVGSDSHFGLLNGLARAGGGQSYAIETSEQATERALRLVSSLKAPTLTELDIDFGAGLDEVFLTANGKVTRGDEVVLLARTHHALPSTVTVKGRIAGESFTQNLAVREERSGAAALVPRLWAAEAIRRTLGGADDPESVRGKIINMGLEYGLMTPYTSFLALESEYAYAQQGVPRRQSPLRGMRLSNLAANGGGDALGLLAGGLVAGLGIGCQSSEQSAPEPMIEQQRRDVAQEYAKTAPMPMAPGAMPVPPPPGAVADAVAPAEAVAAAPADREAAPPALSAEALNALSSSGYAGGGGGGSATGISMIEHATSRARRRAIANEGAATGALKEEMAAAKPQAPASDDYKDRANAAPAPEQERKQVEGDLQQKKDVLASTGMGALVTSRIRAITLQSRYCSDLSERPLAERAAIWRQRLKTARDPMSLVQRYEAARGACELADWRAEALFLRLLEHYIGDEGTATAVLSAFSSLPESQRYLAQRILRRAVDPRMVSAVEQVLFGSKVDWADVDRQLSAIADPSARLSRLRERMAASPDDPEGLIRLVRSLAEAGQKEEALRSGRRLAELGLMTPRIARQLGDLLSGQGLAEEATRAYSEIVEFDPDSPASRRLLGDIFLSHGWYGPAYRQYQVLTGAYPDSRLDWLRLASAAAGAGRVDEALRLERTVAESQGTPGPDDPRRFARMWSAARLARLLADPPKEDSGMTGAELTESVTRKLKELQLFSGPGTLVILTWEDLEAQLALSTSRQGAELALGDRTDAGVVGLYGALMSEADAGSPMEARLRSAPLDRVVKITRQEVHYDGKGFKVSVKSIELPARATGVGI